MQSKAEKIRSKDHPDVALKVIPGHFVTPNSHVNYFLDMTTLKCRLSEASAAAKALSGQISATTVVDTIVCLDGCETIGAFLAEDLTRAGLTAEEDLRESLWNSMKKRLPWLVLLLGLGLVVSSVVGVFESIVSQVAVVICFQSLILDMAGNVGTQSLAVTIRVFQR